MPKRLELTGRRFGRLTVTSFSGCEKGLSKWRCVCDCGNEVDVVGCYLTSGNTKSCGCARRENSANAARKHDGHGTRLYRIWRNMRARCRYQSVRQFNDYGGRGIRVCDEWDDFSSFQKWAFASGYSDDMTIDRIDNSKGYSPDNCKWSTRTQQNRNRRSNHIIDGKTISEWAEESGINVQTLQSRIGRGMTLEQAIKTPVKEQQHRLILGKTIAQWSRETGIHADTLSHRLRSGWDESRAVSEPVRKYAKGSGD